MKRLIFVLFSLMCMSVFGQRLYTYTLTVPTGPDTTYYFKFWTEFQWGAEIDYSNFDTTNAVLDIGSCQVADGSTFCRMQHDSLPYTMADSCIAFRDESFNFMYLAVKITAGDVTAGLTATMRVTRRDPMLVAWIWPRDTEMVTEILTDRFKYLALK